MDTIEQNKVDRNKALELLNNVKPCFEVSNAQILYQLHLAAQQKAANLLNISPTDPNINHFIINTGISEDGRYVSDMQETDVEKAKMKIKKLFHVGNNKYEIGIVMQFTEYKAPKNKDLKDKAHPLKEILKYNESEGTLKEFKKKIVDGLAEYCKWFWGDETYRVDESSVQEFIPDYDDGKVQVSGGEIVSMDEKDILQYLSNRNTSTFKTIKAVQAKGGEKIEGTDKDGKKVTNVAKAGMWIINGNKLMDDSNFQQTYEQSKSGEKDEYVEKNSETKEDDEKESVEYAKPRLGFKIGYMITY